VNSLVVVKTIAKKMVQRVIDSQNWMKAPKEELLPRDEEVQAAEKCLLELGLKEILEAGNYYREWCTTQSSMAKLTIWETKFIKKWDLALKRLEKEIKA